MLIARRCRCLRPLLVLATLACSELNVVAVDVAIVAVEPPAPTLVAGESTRLEVVLQDGSGNRLKGRTVTWASSDAGVASVDGDGNVIALGRGFARITAVAEGRSGEARVTVLNRPVARVEVAPDRLDLVVGQTATVRATTRAADGTVLAERSIAFTVEDPAIASVQTDGMVTAVAPGRTRVVAVSESQSASVDVAVSRAGLESLELTPGHLALAEGDTARVLAALRAADGSAMPLPAITWSSDDGAVVRVDSGGKVVAIAAGSARITAASATHEAHATVDVSAREVADVEVLPGSIIIAAGAFTQLHAVVRAADGTVLQGRSVAWESSEPTTAGVNAFGLVTALSRGSATISAVAGGVAGQASVIVPATLPVPVTTVTVAPAAASLKPDEVLQLTATLRAAGGAVLTGRAVSWTASDARVVVVDAAGNATAMGDGTATITATAEGVSGTSSITVTTPLVPVASVHVQPSSASLAPGETLQLTAETRASDQAVLTGRVVTWRSSDASVVTVDASGNATAQKVGTATITATAEGVSSTAVLTVQTPPGPVAVARVVVSPSFAIMQKGDVLPLHADVLAADGSQLQRTVTWHSSDDRIAVVDAAGRVTAQKKGGALITATVAGKSDAAAIVVLR